QRLAHDRQDGSLRLGVGRGCARAKTPLSTVASSGVSGSPSAAILAVAHRPNTRPETSPLSSSSTCSCRLSLEGHAWCEMAVAFGELTRLNRPGVSGGSILCRFIQTG